MHWLFKATIALIGSGIMLFMVSIPIPGNINPYSWTVTQNTLYFSIGRPIYAIGFLMVLVPLFFGHFEGLKNLLAHKCCRPFAKLNLIAYLLCPTMIIMLYVSGDEAIFLRYT